jgi:hypothetical protein
MGPIAEGYVPPRRDTLGDLDEDAWETDDRGQPRDPWQLTNQIGMVDVGDRSEIYKIGQQATFTDPSRAR